jgi:hypothetical protein
MRQDGQRALPIPAVCGRHMDALGVRPLLQVHITSLLSRTCVCYLEHAEQVNCHDPFVHPAGDVRGRGGRARIDDVEVIIRPTLTAVAAAVLEANGYLLDTQCS